MSDVDPQPIDPQVRAAARTEPVIEPVVDPTTEPAVEVPQPFDQATEAPDTEPVDLERVAAELAAVEDALGRLDDGTYGRCQVCTDPLDDDQLEADPTARVCRAHLDLVS